MKRRRLNWLRSGLGLSGLALMVIACQSLVTGPGEVESVTISNGDFSIEVGASIPLQGATRNADGVAFDGPDILWTSTSPDIAFVSFEGTLTAVAAGSSTVTATSHGKSASVIVTVTPAPAIGFSVPSVTFTTSTGVDPATRVVQILNVGSGSLGALGTKPIVYDTGQPTGWLAASTTATPAELVLRVNVNGLTQGTYQARVPVVAQGALNSPQNFVVTLTILDAAAQIVLTPRFVNFNAISGAADPSPQVVVVSNGGSGSLSNLALGVVNYASGQPAGWLNASLNGGNVTLTATTGVLTQGTYLATVPVIASNALNSPAEIVVAFAVDPGGPAIGLAPSSVMFDGIAGGASPPSEIVDVTNTGGETLAGLQVGTIVYGASEPTGWLMASLGATTAPTTLTLTADPSSLVPGNYTATVPISSPLATNSPQSVTVSFAVSGTGVADTVRFTAGGTAATVGTTVVPNPTVLVVDAFGVPVAGTSVTFTASGDGMVSQASVNTDGSGMASVAWTLGTNADTDSDTLSVSVTGASGIELVATAAPGMATQVAVTAQPAGAVSNQAFTTQPVVQLQDMFGNNVSQASVAITATLNLGAGSLQGTASASTNASGQAMFGNLSINGQVNGIGSHRLLFSSGSLNSTASATFNVATSFAYNVRFVLDDAEAPSPNGCTAAGCHISGGLGDYRVAATMVNQPTSVFVGCGTLIVPFDTTNSIVYRKIRDVTPPCGSQMPVGVGGAQLSAGRMNVIIRWILEGAPNN